MYFNDNKSNTNIDDEFENEHILSRILRILSKYKLYIVIAFIVIILLIIMILFFTNKEITNYLLLSGEESITLYQGTDYIEPGYTAYNSKEEDLTNNVEIKSTLDMSKIGEYEITYTIGEITKIRKITVIAKPEEYTYIYLKTVNDNINVYLKLGETYIEPGYQVFNSSGKKLTSEVKVTGTVDTSKKGNYELIYSVVDSNNVTISATRTVIIMDTEISLSLSTEEYTNTSVNINVGIIDNYFDYIVLPNNNTITQSTYSYSVSKNGTYTFKVYNKKGVSKEASIEVKNINKTSPTGSCSGSYKNGISTINVSAQDDIGINKYVINGTSYTSNKITIKKETKTVNITIYDKAGNTKDISCTLQNKNASSSSSKKSSSSSTNPLDKIYTSSNSHTNSINGVKYLLYNQTDPKWGSVKYPSGDTIGDIGCLITSVAVVSSSYDETITPKTVFDKNRHNYPYDGINQLVDEAFDCEFVYAVNSKNKIITSLSEGKVVVIMAYGRNKGGANPFTGSQHYMALIDYKDDKIFVGNSYSSSGYGRSGWYHQDLVLLSVQEVNICTPTQKLLNRFK